MSPTVTVNSREYTQSIRVLELHADYTCANTGLCCEDTWGIALLAEELPRMKAALARGGMPPEEIERHFVSEARGELGVARLAASAQGCLFHAHEAGCSYCGMQRALGHATLPIICQSFPRAAVRTPAGIYLTLSNACPTAAKSLLRANALGETAPRSVCAQGPQLGGSIFGDRAEAPRFSPACRPGWAAFDYFWRWAPEWLSNPALTPGEALFGLGYIVGHVEGLGAAAADAALLIEQLDQVAAGFPAQLKPLCAQVSPEPLLGAIHFETLLNIAAQVQPLSPELAAVHQGPDARAALVADYTALIRPRLAELALIERNYIGARLFANPLVYRAGSLRLGYFVVVLSAVALRFAALALCRSEGRPLDADLLLRAAGVVDKLLLHNALISGNFMELLEPHIHTDLRNLALPALG